MRIHDIPDADGRVQAFEVSTFFLDRRALRQIVQAIPGATFVAHRPYGERLCEFKLGGVAFLVHEPWGEGKRDWSVLPRPAGVPSSPSSARPSRARDRSSGPCGSEPPQRSSCRNGFFPGP